MDFIEAFNKVATDVHSNAVKHGWWENNRNVGEMIALMHSELSEGLEAFRLGNPPDEHCPEYRAIEVEIADLIIRAMDFAVGMNLRLPEAILAKCEYNKSRPYKHGKTF